MPLPISSAVRITAVAVPLTMTVNVSPALASPGKPTFTTTPSDASVALMPLAFSGTLLILGALGAERSRVRLDARLGVLTLPAASVIVALTGTVPSLKFASVVAETVTFAVAPISLAWIVYGTCEPPMLSVKISPALALAGMLT